MQINLAFIPAFYKITNMGSAHVGYFDEHGPETDMGRHRYMDKKGPCLGISPDPPAHSAEIKTKIHAAGKIY